jgi:hypothetical protein
VDTEIVSVKQEYQKGIMEFEKKVSELPSAKFGDCFPLKHTFAEGLYIREISVPAGQLVITKIHKFSHPVFLLKGDVSVVQEDGIKRIQAPCSFITPAGTKRICYTHEDTVWTTVHATKETDLDKIEEEVIAKDFQELNELETININKLLCESEG